MIEKFETFCVTPSPVQGISISKIPATDNAYKQGYRFQATIPDSSGKPTQWYITEVPWLPDQYPDGKTLTTTSFTLWKKDDPNHTHMDVDGSVLANLQTRGPELKTALHNFLAYLNSDPSRQVADARDNADTAHFDLPKNVPIGYIGMVEDAPDVVSEGLQQDTLHFPAMMNGLNRGYNFVSLNQDGHCDRGILVPKETDPKKPEQLLRDRLDEYLKAGITNIYFDAAAHGHERLGIGFCTMMGPKHCEEYKFLNSQNMLSILNDPKYNSLKFFINTAACKGAGFADGLKQFKDPTGQTGRVTLFLQSKITGLAEEGRLKDQISTKYKSPEVFSTYFNVLFYDYLRQGKPFGEAFRLADKEVKKFIHVDPEVWRSTPAGGEDTTKERFKPRPGRARDERDT